MNKYLENKWVQLALYIMITIIMALIIVPSLDFIHSLLTNNRFIYSAHEHIQRPSELGLVLGIVFWSVEKYIKRNIKKRNDK